MKLRHNAPRNRLRAGYLWAGLFLVAVQVFATTGFAYVLRYTKKTGEVLRWKESCLRYSLYQEGAPNIPIESVRETFRAAFDAWEEVDDAYFYFEATEDASCGQVGHNLDSGNSNLIVFVSENWTDDEDPTPRDSRAIALTTTAWDDISGRLIDADMEFNAVDFIFSTDAAPGTMDLQNTATHEIGHMLGLDESDTWGSTMYPSASFTETDKRTLSTDDIAAVITLYPIEKDPGICRDPICGLDLSCSSTACSENPFAENDEAAGCTLTSSGHRTSRFHLFDLLTATF